MRKQRQRLEFDRGCCRRRCHGARGAGGGTPVAVTAADKSDVVQSLTVEPVSVAAGQVTFTFKNTGNRQHEMIVLKTDEKADALESRGRRQGQRGRQRRRDQ